MTHAIDWVAEAKRIGEWDFWPGKGEGAIRGEFVDVWGYGETEQLAARDAVLRLRKLCRVVRPEAEAVIEAAKAGPCRHDSTHSSSGCRMCDTLAALDAKERDDG